MGAIFLKIVLSILVIALIIIGVLVIVMALSALWSYIQDCLYDEWGYQLPPRKDDWDYKWLDTGKVTKDVVPQKIMRCEKCSYKTTTMSRCCPSCGRYMNNWDTDWDWRKEDDLE